MSDLHLVRISSIHREDRPRVMVEHGFLTVSLIDRLRLNPHRLELFRAVVWWPCDYDAMMKMFPFVALSPHQTPSDSHLLKNERQTKFIHETNTILLIALIFSEHSH